jgi:hypothetical protein
MLDKKRKFGGALFGAVMSVLLLATAGLALLNQQYIRDQIVVWSYVPTTALTTIEERIDLSPLGEFHFRATQPQVATSTTFNEDCPRQETTSPILGCYTSAHRIYIYDITNEQLDGLEEVTAAHEMLHAAWERTSAEKQAEIGKLLRAEYEKYSSNSRFTQRMAYYERTEPGQFENELHSILATESKTLGPELETYYGRYFNDRQKVVALYEQYNTVFATYKEQADTLYTELTTLGASIDTRTIQYNGDVTQLSADIAAFNARADSADFSSVGAFNSARAALVIRSNQADADRAAISADIATHNTKYEQYQQVAAQLEFLNNSIDSFTELQQSPSV